MRYYRIFLKNRVIDYAYSIEQLKEVIADNKVDYIELFVFILIFNFFNLLEEVIKEGD